MKTADFMEYLEKFYAQMDKDSDHYNYVPELLEEFENWLEDELELEAAIRLVKLKGYIVQKRGM